MKKNLKKNILIFKNDAVGDLVQSLDAINNIVINNKGHNIIIYLSERSKYFDFLFDRQKIKILNINYDLSLLEKFKIIYQLLITNTKAVYILTPKNFYFYLPLIFKNIKFYALCVNSINNYKRPGNFFRKYLYKFVVNERDKITKRESTMEIQRQLTRENKSDERYKIGLIPKFNYDDFTNVKNYIYFHLKISNFNKLGWGITELKMIFEEFLKYKKKVIFTRDIEKLDAENDYKSIFNVVDFNTKEKILNNTNIYLYDNIKGSDLYNVIRNADKIVSFHGMMTNLASIEKKPVLDLFYCNIKTLEDFRRYKNALYEFKPNYKNYDFIVPSKNIKKTINKMQFFLKKDL